MHANWHHKSNHILLHLSQGYIQAEAFYEMAKSIRLIHTVRAHIFYLNLSCIMLLQQLGLN